MVYTIWRVEGIESGTSARIDDGDFEMLSYIGEVTADHSTAAILAAGAMFPTEEAGEWVAIPKDQLNRLVMTSQPSLVPGE